MDHVHLHAATERTYELGLDAELPHLAAGRVATVAEPVVTELRATYFDTSDLALAAAGISLRSCQGGPDPSWHLVLPAGGDTRVEIRRALGRGVRVPVALTRLLAAVTVGDPLLPKIVVATARTSYDLVGDEGTIVATASDDVVTATVPDGTPLRWRQVEVKVFGGDGPLLDEIHRTLEAADMQRSDSPSKLQRALRSVDPAPQRPRPRPVLSEESAGAALHRYLVEQRCALTRADLAVRTMAASVHDLRVAARRIRAAITVYRPLLDTDKARHLQGELRWIGRELSDLRDVEVAGEALFAALDDKSGRHPEEPTRLQADRARGLLQRELTATEQPASAAAESALGSGRYLALLTKLDMLLATPPWTDRASAGAEVTLPTILAKPHRRLRRAVKAAADTGPDERTSALHNVRKAAKRLRYSLEVAEPTLGDPAHRLANAAKHVQSLLGDHLDAVATAGWLLRLGHAPDAGPASFTFGRLYARNEEQIPRPLDNYEHAVKQVLKGKRSRFLRSA